MLPTRWSNCKCNGISYSKIHQRLGNYRQVSTISVTDKFFDSDIGFEDQQLGVDLRTRPLQLRYRGEHTGDKTKTIFDITAATNLSGGRYNDDETYNTARSGASQDWTSYRLEFTHEHRIRRWSLNTHFSGQYSDEPLVTGEQFGVGGSHNLRGLKGREYSGDRGARLNIDLLAPILKNGLRFGWFIDTGYVKRIDPLPEEMENQTVSSTGFTGTWHWKQRIQLDTRFGYVFHVEDETMVSHTAEGDERGHFNLTYYFQQ